MRAAAENSFARVLNPHGGYIYLGEKKGNKNYKIINTYFFFKNFNEVFLQLFYHKFYFIIVAIYHNVLEQYNLLYYFTLYEFSQQ